MLSGKKILLGVTGSIAAYKAIWLVRLLIRENAEVKIILTPSAKDFVSPLTLETLSHNPVLSEISEGSSWSNHVLLGRWADIMVIAPLSCNTLSKMATGLCDNLLMAVYLSATCPVIVAPAMDEDMWHHPTTKENLGKIQSAGNKLIPVGTGELASGLFGEGRMAEAEEILEHIKNQFKSSVVFSGKKALITAGPTQESIDAVRYISNQSSGKMGIAIAEVLKERGAEVTLILGPSAQTSNTGAVIRVITADEMYHAVMKDIASFDIIIMAAAVADYQVEKPARNKIKKGESESLDIRLIKTHDILKAIGSVKRKDQLLVGFALETDNEKENALKKLKEKNLDFIVLNSLNDKDAGFGHDSNKITIFDRQGNEYPFSTKSKKMVAFDIVETLITHNNV